MKSRLTFLAIAAIAVSLFSCHKNDDSSSSLQVKIIGTWDEQFMYTYAYQNGELSEQDTTMNEAGDYTKFEFKPDHTVTVISSVDGDTEQGSGTYSLKGKKLIFVGIDPEDQSKDSTIMDCTINGSQMIWTQEATISGTSGQTARVGVKFYFNKE